MPLYNTMDAFIDEFTPAPESTFLTVTKIIKPDGGADTAIDPWKLSVIVKLEDYPEVFLHFILKPFYNCDQNVESVTVIFTDEDYVEISEKIPFVSVDGLNDALYMRAFAVLWD